MAPPILVLGAGMVGVSVALQLALRGLDVALVDRDEPGRGASFGNAGIIQREAVFPTAFPRAAQDLARIARNRSVDVSYHASALPPLASRLLRYWWHSAPPRYGRAVAGHAALIGACLEEHQVLAAKAGASVLLRPTGYLRLYSQEQDLAAAEVVARRARQEHGVAFRLLDGAALAAEVPALRLPRLGAVHWTDPVSVPDPLALTRSYLMAFQARGGTLLRGDAAGLRRQGAGWTVPVEGGAAQAAQVVVALGAAAPAVTRPLGFAPPGFGKRGYHLHLRPGEGPALRHPVYDHDAKVMLVPMRAGIRMTSGVEFAAPTAEPTPVQLLRALPQVRALLPLGEPVEQAPWMGVRPCSPDMLPLIGPVPGQAGLWAAFGHGHQGFTLGPATGRLLAEMMTGARPFLDPAPYDPARFA
jgi:D-amino-acid dehydrogenase